MSENAGHSRRLQTWRISLQRRNPLSMAQESVLSLLSDLLPPTELTSSGKRMYSRLSGEVIGTLKFSEWGSAIYATKEIERACLALEKALEGSKCIPGGWSRQSHLEVSFRRRRNLGGHAAWRLKCKSL